MKVEMDAVTNEYMLDALETVPEPNKPARSRERAVTVALKTLINSGLVTHRYDARKGVDEFRATERLIQRWTRDFPALTAIVAPTETIVVKVGKRSRTFADNLMPEKASYRH